MLAKGNVKVTGLLGATPPAIPEGSHAMTQLVELPPADAGLAPHRHSGPLIGYVLEGRILFELEGEELREIVAGEAFWEPGGDVVHYQVANLDADTWSRFVAVCICAPGVDVITMLQPEEVVARDHLRHVADTTSPCLRAPAISDTSTLSMKSSRVAALALGADAAANSQ